MTVFRHVLIFLAGAILYLELCADGDAVASSSPASVKFDFAQWCKVGGHKFTFESVTLDEVRKALGCGQVVNVDANDPGNADSLWALNYRSGENVVRFEADGDMGGPEHRVTGISIGPAADFPAGQFPTIKEPVEFRFGELRMNFFQFQRRLGVAGLRNNKAAFEYSGTTKIPSRRDVVGSSIDFDVSGYMSVDVIDGKVAKIVMSHITTS